MANHTHVSVLFWLFGATIKLCILSLIFCFDRLFGYSFDIYDKQVIHDWMNYLGHNFGSILSDLTLTNGASSGSSHEPLHPLLLQRMQDEEKVASHCILMILIIWGVMIVIAVTFAEGTVL